MDKQQPNQSSQEAYQQILGYLNFSEGKPDSRFQKTLSDLFADQQSGHACEKIYQGLSQTLKDLHAGDSPAFKDVTQAEAVLSITFEKVLPAYRQHHSDLLFHLSDDELFQPFLLVRVMENVLAQGPAHKDPDAVTQDVLKKLNDYVGHRPIAILETRPRGEPYDHERVRPIPLYIQGAGVATGKYQKLITKALEILQATDPDLLAEAFFDFANLEELAVDPRAYDHGHPVNRRPNYVFGEWDPHLIDNKGNFRRFVLRQITLDSILDRTKQSQVAAEEDLLFDAAAVLAGTILMASGVSGRGPETHDSSVTLANLIPRIARYRDAFYKILLDQATGPLAVRLHKEKELTKQPFGGARQHLNQYLARHRASQLQQRHLALLMAELGYPEASRKHAAKIPAASVRMLSEIHIRLALGVHSIEIGDLEKAAEYLKDIEDLLHRGIACGALADPWNILGFGGLFPLFHSMQDSVRDPRIEELVEVVDYTFNLYSRLLSETAATGKKKLTKQLAKDMKRQAAWWDQFATTEVSDIQSVQGKEAASSAKHVAHALRLWHERGKAPADLAFWQEHLENLQSTKAFALVVDALLKKGDYRAAMGLLMHWLSQLNSVPLEDGEYSFHPLAIRWMLAICQSSKDSPEESQEPEEFPAIVIKFFDYLEANAEDYWSVPQLEIFGVPLEETGVEVQEEEDDEDDIFQAAYENMTYQDSTDDDVESEVLEVGPQPDFDLEVEGERIENHLHFLSTVARLWSIATRSGERNSSEAADNEANPANRWLNQAKENYHQLLSLLDKVYEYPIPRATGNYDSIVEFDRRRVIRDRLLHVIIGTCLDTWLAVGSLRSRLRAERQVKGWKSDLILLEEALWKGDSDAIRNLVPHFLESFQIEPLLFSPLSNGGHPRDILRASRAQTILRTLVANLPRAGALMETQIIVQRAHQMERAQPLAGQRVTEFDRLFQIACQSSVEAVIDSAEEEGEAITDERLVLILERLIQPFLLLWKEHSSTLRVAILETITDKSDWDGLVNFIKKYGRSLFHVRFMTLGNLRGILHQGVGEFLHYLEDNQDPMNPVELVDDLDKKVNRKEVQRWLSIILQTSIENYESYKDYNATAPQSDYGDNLYILLDFLRLKAGYERQAWQFRPLFHVHEVLAQRRPSAAEAWQARFTAATKRIADDHIHQLGLLEKQHGIRLNTVSDRLQERFVQPLGMDRLCAMVEPVMRAAHQPEADKVLADFEEKLKPYAETPTGVGLDIPQWLQRLNATIQQERASKTTIADLAENLLQIPQRKVPFAKLDEQLSQITTMPASSDVWTWMMTMLSPASSLIMPPKS